MKRGAHVLILLFLAAPALGEDWPHWRGPSRSGISAEGSGWDGKRWLDGKPLWSANVGEGGTSPLVVNGKVFTLGHQGAHDRVVCLDAATGKEDWAVTYKAPRYGRHHMGDEVLYSGPCATPEYDPETGYLYTLGIDGDLACWDTGQEGKKVWGFNLYDKYGMPRRPKVGRGGQQRDYGYTTAPLLEDNKLLVQVGGKAGNMVAFERDTGKQAWASECKDLASHSGGMVPLVVEGERCLAVLTLTELVVLKLHGEPPGKTVATFPWAVEFANGIASPVAVGSDIILTAGYNQARTCKIHISLRGAKLAWEQPVYSKVCSPVVNKGKLYWAWQKVRCLDLETGKPLWEGGAFSDPGSVVVTADDRLVIWGGLGRLALAETASRSPTEYHEVARLDRVASIHAWPHVVLAEGRLFCKDRRGNLKCFALPGKKPAGK